MFFFVEINFEVTGDPGDLFSVAGNGNDYGEFLYDDLPITVGPLEGDGVTEYEFVVTDNIDPNCSDFTVIDPVNCDIQGDCSITELVVDPQECNDDGTYSIIINFEYQNPGNDFFDLFDGNNEFLGFYALNELPITYENFIPSGNDFDVITVCINDMPNCCATEEFLALDCPPAQCNISNVVADPGLCDGLLFWVTINFDFENTGDQFSIQGNGTDYGDFFYDDLPVTVGPMVGDGQTEYEFVVSDLTDPNCSDFTVIDPIQCDVNNCEIWDLVVEAHDCDGEFFLVDLDFNYENTSDSFEVHGNGNNYGTFAYNDLYITLGPFEGNGQVMEFVVYDQQDDGCSAEAVLDAPYCPGIDCEIWGLGVEAHECDGEFFLVDLFFNYENTSDSFEVHGNGNNYGTFSYQDLFITLGPFEGNGQALEFIVFDQQDDGCNAEVVFEAPYCPGIDCEIWNVVAEAHDCDDNDQFLLDLDFDYENTSDSFVVLGNGNNYGTFAYEDLFITLGPFEGNGQVLEFIIFDQQDDNCSAEIVFEAPSCPVNNCEIWDLVVEAGDCTPNEIFFVDIDFNYANTSDSFEVHGNGNNYGTFAYDDLFITLGPFNGDGQVLEFVVYDQLLDNCSAEAVITAPNCGNQDCNISELVVDPLECNDDGTYSILINFEYQNPNNDFFDLYNGNGNLLGFYALDDLPLTYENFVPSGNNFDVITVCINDMPNCCATAEFEALDCPNDNCEIWDLIAEAYDCDNNGQFLVDIDFNFQNTSDSFTVIGNGNNYGTFAYNDLYITLGPFEGNGQILEFIIFDQQDDGCNAEVGLEAPNCGNQDCNISELVVDPLECNDDGTYSVLINFEYQNPNNDFFDLYDGNGNLLGFYALDDLPLTYENFVPSGNNFDVITVCINDMPNCCATAEFEALDCPNDNCEIWDLIAEAYDCDNNGQFLVDIDFNFQNTSDSFTVVGNGNNYGTFAYNDLYITLGPFEGNGQILEFIIFDQQDDGCNAEVGLEAPNCGNQDCNISELVVDPLECNDDGTYSILINFEYQNPNNDFFDLYDGNGNFLGFYALDDVPLTYENFVPSGNNFDVITVCINDMPNCCATAEFEALDCPNDNCEIWDLIAEAYDCDNNGQFLVDIDFNFQNTSDSFTVIGNGNNYGTFAYNDLYITLGPFEGNGQVLEFIIFDQQDDGCNAEVGLEAPNCGNQDCNISELVVDPLECNDDGTYSIAINFQYENPGNDFFDVFDGNGNIIGFFSLNELPVVIQNFVPSGNNFDIITVCINDMPNCCATTEFEALDCEIECQIFDLVAEPFCDGDDLYVEFSFEYSGVSDNFNVLACDYLATFEYGQNSYVIQIPDDQVDCAGGIIIPIAIFDQENDACGDAVEIEIPDCYNTGCIIGDIETEISDCENGEFYVTIDFDYQDVSDEGFHVFGNGNNYGEFDYAQLPITLGPFEANGQELEFIVVDLLDEECWNFTEIEAPFCTEEANTCIEFESLYNGVNYGGPNSDIGDLLLIENGVYVTIEGVTDPLGNLNYDYLFATNQDICSPFEMASGIRMFMFNGLRFDFSELDENPSLIVFNYHNCGVPFAISVNGQEPLTYVLPDSDYSFALTPNVTVHFDVDENNTDEGIATFEGDIESLFTGGVEFQIDNVCFNVDDELTDVWPGDANNDNLASHFDLLNVGIAFGKEGSERDIINNDWFAMPGEDWDDEFLNEANYKHADCNGDGIVNFDDKVAIVQNYGLTHGEVPIFIPLEGTENDPALFVDLPEASEIELNSPFEATIELGTVNIPVDEIYGLAFTIEFDAEMMDEDQVHVELGSSWLGVNGESLITIDKKFAPEGIIEVALTRNTQANIGGQGTIGYFIGIIDDILGKSEVEVKIRDVKAINYSEMPVPLYTPTEIVDIITSIDTEPFALDLEVFPNPTDDVLNIQYHGTESMQSIKIYNTLGQLITEFSDPNPQQKVDVSNWSAGIYFVKIEIGDAIFCEKIKVTRL